ncbi:hypothetical protein ACIQMV_38330 [Streptomyces sp. NPDC091412]|uniref:hypothetical protein n=1 Tax=Streptomyces sp. NPDC091412 TaxID=3366002 RepID=UPI003821B0ED
MPPELIRVQPAPGLRRDFAMWAVAQVPKVRTVSQSEFAVPAREFTNMPERLLIGAIVDGHRYVSPDEEQAGDSGGAELLGVGLPEREGIPGEPLPPVPDEAYRPDSTPLPPPDFAPLEDAPTYEAGEVVLVGEDGPETYVPLGDPLSEGPADIAGDTAGDAGPFACGICPRDDFKSARGRDTHRRQAHRED